LLHHFFLFFLLFSPPLCAVIGNKPLRRYYHSLDHNDKTWISEAWAQHRPWPDVKKSTMAQQSVSFPATQFYPTGASFFSASFKLSPDNRGPPALGGSRRRNGEKPRFDTG